MTDFNSSLYVILGERIKKRRTELAISQESLAKAVGLGRTSITNIELGKHNVPLPILYKISEFLALDIHMVLPTFDEIESKRSNTVGAIESRDSLNEILNSKQIDEKSLITLKELLNKL